MTHISKERLEELIAMMAATAPPRQEQAWLDIQEALRELLRLREEKQQKAKPEEAYGWWGKVLIEEIRAVCRSIDPHTMAFVADDVAQCLRIVKQRAEDAEKAIELEYARLDWLGALLKNESQAVLFVRREGEVRIKTAGVSFSGRDLVEALDRAMEISP